MSPRKHQCCKEKAPTATEGNLLPKERAATELTSVLSLWELESSTGSGRVNMLLFLFVSREHFWQARCSCTQIVYKSLSSSTWRGIKRPKQALWRTQLNYFLLWVGKLIRTRYFMQCYCFKAWTQIWHWLTGTGHFPPFKGKKLPPLIL